MGMGDMRAALLAAAFALAIPAAAAGPDTFTWDTSGGSGTNNPVEQQSPALFQGGSCDPEPQDGCVYNHTGCVWDVDDVIYNGGAGTLDTGQTETRTLCVIADNRAHRAIGSVLSPSGDLTVTLTSSQGETLTAVPVFYANNHRWSYVLCDRTAVSTGYPEISGSNGGHGQRVDFTVSIVADRRAKATAELRVQGGGCG